MSQLQQFLDVLRQYKEIVTVHKEVSSDLEIAEIHRRVVTEGGPALLFKHVKGSPFPVVTNLFGTQKRVHLAFGDPEQHLTPLLSLLKGTFGIQHLWKHRSLLNKIFSIGLRSRSHHYHRSHYTAFDLPILKTWPGDGGAFLTLPLVYTESSQGVANLGIYRMQRFDATHFGLHMQLGRGGAFHLEQAKARGTSLPVVVYLGGHPLLMLSAIAPLPENISELMLCSYLLDRKLSVDHLHETPYPILTECEFVLIGEVNPYELHEEGPFGDHYGYYSLQHPFPLFHCHTIYHTAHPIFPATVVGKPRQEDFYLGCYLQKMLSPILSLMFPNISSLWSYGECGFHALAACIIQERYERESIPTAFRILGEGQLNLTKCLLITDQRIDLEDFPTTLRTVLERCDPRRDLYIITDTHADTLDYTGPSLHHGSRMVMIGCGGIKRSLPSTLPPLPSSILHAVLWIPGCLVVDIQGSIESLYSIDIPLIMIVDDAIQATSSTTEFLWTCFTRFDPASDLYSRHHLIHYHVCYTFPIIIDARHKPSYPPVVEPDPDTQQYVQDHWNEYFA